MMRKTLIVPAMLLLLGACAPKAVAPAGQLTPQTQSPPQNTLQSPAAAPAPAEQTLQNTQTTPLSGGVSMPGISMPLAEAPSRITKKPFGIYVTPQDSPVQPEHFSGYHTGTDFEILPGELDKDVHVSAICDGKILVKRTARGYGGVLVESCNLDNQAVTVIYGHLRLTSISKKTGDNLASGESFALLGNAYSAETGGERKHLHLGIHKGTGVDILGYVQNQADLSGWMDFQKLVSS